MKQQETFSSDYGTKDLTKGFSLLLSPRRTRKGACPKFVSFCLQHGCLPATGVWRSSGQGQLPQPQAAVPTLFQVIAGSGSPWELQGSCTLLPTSTVVSLGMLVNTGVTARQGARADTRGEPGRLLICPKSFRRAEAPPSVRAGPGHGALPPQLPERRSRTGPRDGPGLPPSTCAAASGLSARLRSARGGLGLPSPSPPPQPRAGDGRKQGTG